MTQHIKIMEDPTTPGQFIAYPDQISVWRDDQVVMWLLDPGIIWAAEPPITFNPPDPDKGVIQWPGETPSPVGQRQGAFDKRNYVALCGRIIPLEGAVEKYAWTAMVAKEPGTPSSEIAIIATRVKMFRRSTDIEAVEVDPDLFNRPQP